MFIFFEVERRETFTFFIWHSSEIIQLLWQKWICVVHEDADTKWINNNVDFCIVIINSLIVFLSRRPSTSVDRSEIFLVWSIACTRREGESWGPCNLHRSRNRAHDSLISINVRFIIESKTGTDWDRER